MDGLPRPDVQMMRRLAWDEQRRESVKRGVGTGKYSRRLLTTTLIVLSILIIRSIFVTSAARRDYNLPEAWSLLVSLKLDDYLNVIFGSVINYWEWIGLALVIVLGWLYRLETPPVYLSTKWRAGGTTIGIIFATVFIGGCLLLEADWWFKIAVLIIAAMFVTVERMKGGFPQMVDLRTEGSAKWAKFHAEKIRTENARHLESNPALETYLRDLVRAETEFKKAHQKWVALQDYLRTKSQEDGEIDTTEPVVNVFNLFNEADATHRSALRSAASARLRAKQKFTLKKMQRNSSYHRLARRFINDFIPGVFRLLIFVPLIATFVVMTSRIPWVPIECFVLDDNSEITGYRMSDTGSLLTILIDSPRQVLAEPTSNVTTIETGACGALAARPEATRPSSNEQQPSGTLPSEPSGSPAPSSSADGPAEPSQTSGNG